MGSKTIQQFSVKFGLTDSLDTDKTRIQGSIQRIMKTVETDLATPFQNVGREVDLLSRKIEKIGDAASRGLAPQKMLSDLDQISQRLDHITARVGDISRATGGSAPGLGQITQSIGDARAALRGAQSIAIPSPSLRAEEQQKVAEFNQLAANRARTQSIIEYERMGAATRPVYTNEDPRERQARLLRNDPQSYGRMFGGLLDERDRSSQAIVDRNQAFNRQADAYNRNLSPYRGTTNYGRLTGSIREDDEATDLTSQFNRLNVVGRNADIIINRHMKEVVPFRQRQEEAFNRNQDPYGKGGTDYSRLRGSLAIDELQAPGRKAQQLELSLRNEAQAVDQLAARYARLSQEQRDAMSFRLQARAASGMDVDLAQTALSRANDPSSQARRGAGMLGYLGGHNFRYASQNAAFALEDYMISSQFGGPKAGFRAITNNLTAIAAASTMGMNPLMSAGIIAGTAVLGAGAPFVYDAVQGGQRNYDKTRAIELSKSRADIHKQQMLDSIAYGISGRRVGSTSGLIARAGSADDQVDADSLRRQALMPEYEYAKQNLDFYSANQGRTNIFGPSSRLTEARTSFEKIQAEVDKIPNRSAESEAISARLAVERDRKLYQSLHRERATELGFDESEARGQLVDPLARFNNARDATLKRREHERRRILGSGSPEELDSVRNQWRAEDDENDRRLSIDRIQYKRQLQERDWSYRGRLAGLDTNDNRRIKRRAVIDAERIDADQSLTQDQKASLRAGLEKATARELRETNRTPDLGHGVEVGSAADLSLRQNMFGGGERNTKDSQVEGLLTRIATELEKLTAATKANKPAAANVRSK